MDKTENTKWVRLGDYIEIYDRKNTEGKPYPFFGINKDKAFMPTVADTNELDNTKYKVVENGVFVFNGMHVGRDIAICIALYAKSNPIIVSPAYTTFKVKDEAELLPEFLFLQLSREEFGRYGWFLCDASVRGGLDWRRFCDIEIPLPPIEVQQELVDAYSGIKAIAEQNEALCQRLSVACHAYIVDCRAKYDAVPLGEHIEEYNIVNSDNTIKNVKSVSVFKEFRDTGAKVNKEELSKYKIVQPAMLSYVQTTKNEKCFACSVNHFGEPIVVTSVNKVIKSKDSEMLDIDFLFLFFARKEFDRYAIFNSWGSAREVFQWEDFKAVKIPLPPIEVQRAIVEVFNCAERAKKIAAEARERLKTLCPALIQRAANS